MSVDDENWRLRFRQELDEQLLLDLIAAAPTSTNPVTETIAMSTEEDIAAGVLRLDVRVRMPRAVDTIITLRPVHPEPITQELVSPPPLPEGRLRRLPGGSFMLHDELVIGDVSAWQDDAIAAAVGRWQELLADVPRGLVRAEAVPIPPTWDEVVPLAADIAELERGFLRLSALREELREDANAIQTHRQEPERHPRAGRYANSRVDPTYFGNLTIGGSWPLRIVVSYPPVATTLSLDRLRHFIARAPGCPLELPENEDDCQIISCEQRLERDEENFWSWMNAAIGQERFDLILTINLRLVGDLDTTVKLSAPIMMRTGDPTPLTDLLWDLRSVDRSVSSREGTTRSGEISREQRSLASRANFDAAYGGVAQRQEALIRASVRRSELAAGLVYAPYVPLQITAAMLDPDDFSLRKGFRIRRRNACGILGCHATRIPGTVRCTTHLRDGSIGCLVHGCKTTTKEWLCGAHDALWTTFIQLNAYRGVSVTEFAVELSLTRLGVPAAVGVHGLPEDATGDWVEGEI